MLKIKMHISIVYLRDAMMVNLCCILHALQKCITLCNSCAQTAVQLASSRLQQNKALMSPYLQ